VKLVTSGAGAAALACLGLLVKLGIPRENIWVTDLAGVVYEGRTELMDEDKRQFAQKTEPAHPERSDRRRRRVPRPVCRWRAQAGHGEKMATRPLIFALANPNPEIQPET
jgi:malate dehydrogenase (oxaloacetate-decarboxylating)(NADP+)